MRLITILAALALATTAQAAEAPKPTPTAAELQTQLDVANRKVATLQTAVALIQQQRDAAQKQASDEAVDLYIATHPAPPAPDKPK